MAGPAKKQRTRPSAYLDTCLVSGLVEGDLSPVEREGLRKVLEAHKTGRLGVVTSHVTLEELAAMSPPQRRAPHETIYSLLVDVPAVPEARTDSSLSLLGVGGGTREDPDFAALKVILPDVADARHVFQALRNGVAYFVTADARTIVSRAKTLEASFPSIKIRLPSQLAAELSL
jgi:hypothetical protein